MKYDWNISKIGFFVEDPITRNCILASTTKCANTLKSLAYFPHQTVRNRVYLNFYSTEEVHLAVKSYEKFGHLTK
jgi:hypothetical protein